MSLCHHNHDLSAASTHFISEQSFAISFAEQHAKQVIYVIHYLRATYSFSSPAKQIHFLAMQ